MMLPMFLNTKKNIYLNMFSTKSKIGDIFLITFYISEKTEKQKIVVFQIVLERFYKNKYISKVNRKFIFYKNRLLVNTWSFYLNKILLFLY